MFGHFVPYMLMPGHKNMQVYFCLVSLIVFHVKQSIARVATGCLHTGMTEHETVRL